MLYSHYQKSKSNSYEIVKCVISVLLFAGFTYALFAEPEVWVLVGLLIALFFTFLDGIKKLMTKDQELQFLEITKDSLRYRRYDGGTVDTIKSSSIEIVLISPSYLEVGTKGVSYTLYIDHGSSSIHELVEIFHQITPNAIIKTTQHEND